MLLFSAAASFAVLWGYAENRLFHEQGELHFLGHFKDYHVFLASLVALISFLGAEGSGFNFAFLAIWNILVLDVVWWLKRYWDIKHGFGTAYLPETNAWHSREDWDNFLGFPLILNTYWWWWLFGASLAALGALSL